MGRMTRSSLHDRFLAVPIVMLALIFVAPAAYPADEVITELSMIKDIDFAGLTDDQKQAALRIMNENGCNCGCQMTIAVCRLRDQSCRRSLIFARTIVDAFREGKSEAEVLKTLQAKAATFVEARLPDDSGMVYDIDMTNNPVRGSKDAPIAIVEFSDFQCPYCAGIQKTLEEVRRAFPKEVRIVFKQYPLNIHQYARQAAAASLAAHAQGKFWELHDKLFQNFTAINEENIRRWAEEVGMDMSRFEREMQMGAYEAAVQKDMADGAAAKVLGTPTVFVNGKRIRDKSFETFKTRIQEELAAIRSGSKRASGASGSN
jgi:protein-disulfide isomerase